MLGLVLGQGVDDVAQGQEGSVDVSAFFQPDTTILEQSWLIREAPTMGVAEICE